MLQHKFNFKIGDAFPASEASARFVVSICAQVNDLVLVNELFLKSLGRKRTARPENQYLLRTVASHSWEVGTLLRHVETGWKDPNRRAFYQDVKRIHASLSPSGRADWTLVRKLVDNNTKSKIAVNKMRNNGWHYPKPDDPRPNRNDSKNFVKTLGDMADVSGEIVFGEKVKEFRATFADDLLLRLPFDGEQLSDAVFKSVTVYIRDVSMASIRLGQEIIGVYYGMNAETFKLTMAKKSKPRNTKKSQHK